MTSNSVSEQRETRGEEEVRKVTKGGREQGGRRNMKMRTKEFNKRSEGRWREGKYEGWQGQRRQTRKGNKGGKQI